MKATLRDKYISFIRLGNKKVFLFLLMLSNASWASENMMEASEKEPGFNIRVQPLMLGSGPSVDVEADYKISKRFALGLNVVQWAWPKSGWDLRGNSLDITSYFFFEEVFRDGWYLKGGVGTQSLSVTYTESSGFSKSFTSNGLTVKAGGGYHWFWRRFNVNLGAYYAATPSTSETLYDSDHRLRTYDYPHFGMLTDVYLGWTF